jgi:hypothetical protein
MFSFPDTFGREVEIIKAAEFLNKLKGKKE